MSLLRQFTALIVGTWVSFAPTPILPAAASFLPSSGSSIAPATAQPAPSVGPSAPIRELLGLSGNVRALIGVPASIERDPEFAPLLASVPVDQPGVHALGLTAPDGDSLSFIALSPFANQRSAQLAGYRLGSWPEDGLTARGSRYAPPAGYIQVTPENQFTRISKHFRLADFLTHDQADVWPKVLVLRPPLVDKLELISEELQREGLPDHLHVMSGFRTPQYNALGVGPKGGRASHSRHMYGDAADVFVDADGNGVMDDLNGDGKVTVADARVLFAAAERVESAHPDLVGGLSAYPANSAHGPFVHVDVRGVRARW